MNQKINQKQKKSYTWAILVCLLALCLSFISCQSVQAAGAGATTTQAYTANTGDTKTGATEVAATASNATTPTIIADGYCGGALTWKLDEEGTLTIEGTGEMTWYWGGDQFPWYPYRNQVKKLVIEEGATNIIEEAFMDFRALREVSLPTTMKEIRWRAFEGCSYLKKINLPENLQRVSEKCFSGCTSLQEVEIPDSITSIGESAFYGCSNLTAVKLPYKLERIGSSAFASCVSLEKIYYVDGNGRVTENTIPDGVTSLEKEVFANCISLKTLSLNKVKKIGNEALLNCGLDSIIISQSVYSVGNYAIGFQKKNEEYVAVEDFMIIGTLGSVAYGYAERNGIFFYDIVRYEANMKSENKVGSVYVKWNPAPNVEFYQIYRKEGDQEIFEAETDESYYVDTNVTNGKKYTYVVYAVYTCEVREKLDSTSIIYVSAITGFSGTNIAVKSIKTKWNKNSKSDGYVLQYSKSSSFSSSKSITISKLSTVSKVIRKLTKNGKYYIRIRAYKVSNSKKYYSAWNKYRKSIAIKK